MVPACISRFRPLFHGSGPLFHGSSPCFTVPRASLFGEISAAGTYMGQHSGFVLVFLWIFCVSKSAL